MIEIRKKKRRLYLTYSPENQPIDWVTQELDEHDSVTLSKTFHFTPTDVVHDDQPDDDLVGEEEITFLLGIQEGAYYRIKSEILGLQYDLLLSQDLDINRKTFVAERSISIFSKIDSISNEPIIVGGAEKNAIPIPEFERLIKNFPTTTELTHYAHSRVSLILREYLGSMTDAQKKLDAYLERKPSFAAVSEVAALYDYEQQKFEYIRNRIQEMLKTSSAYSEAEWQRWMLNFILLIFPKYILTLQNVAIEDSYSNPMKKTKRFIDLALVDAKGNLDVIEIKKPFDDCLLATARYRDNYTPKKELSGTIMQAEKYLFHLSKWGVIGEEKLTSRYAAQLPAGMNLRVTNPKALIIIGRSQKFSAEQYFDFEIMKRKYANILDIITYDDLLLRLDNIIDKFKKRP